MIEFIKNYQAKGISEVICTDISRDGMLTGPSLALYAEIIQRSSVKLIASGGISSMGDLLLLKEIGCTGAIVGKAIYEGNISLKQLSKLC